MQNCKDAQSELESARLNGQRRDGSAKPGGQSRISVVIEDFSFLWFTLSMNTGIMSILMHQSPYQFHGLGVLSTIMFIFNLVLFSAMFLIGLTASTAHWGGAFFLVAYVGWWIGTAVMVTVAVLVIVIVGKTNIINSDTLTPAMVLPFVGTATNAVVGALIVSQSSHVNARLAIPVIITSYILAGSGFFAATMIYAAYFVKLMNTGLPSPEKTPGLMLLIGPSGQSAAAAQLLGNASQKFFGAYDRGTFFQATAGNTLATVGVLLGLMFVGLGLLFAAFAIYVIVETAFKRQHKYSLIWWSTIFPLATINTAWIEFAKDLDSSTFRVLATIFLLLLLVDYFINWAFTLRDIYMGKLLSGRRAGDAASGRPKEH
ncbi:hypothetical protein LTR08_001880 [Meristemomyces frigidus]|nr:hypothetical protein LTR08_001880 [Meristemomyces frigidus]